MRADEVPRHISRARAVEDLKGADSAGEIEESDIAESVVMPPDASNQGRGSPAAAWAYCFASVALTLFNQAVFAPAAIPLDGQSSEGFSGVDPVTQTRLPQEGELLYGWYGGFGYRGTALLSLLQQLAIAAGALFARRNGVTDFSLMRDGVALDYTWRTSGFAGVVEKLSMDPVWIAVAPLAVIQMGGTLLSFVGMQNLALSMFTTLRRLSVVFVLAFSMLANGPQSISKGVLAGIALIVAGALVAGASDLSFNLVGYVAMFLTNTASSFYASRVASLKKFDIPLMQMLLMNALVTIPLLFIGAVVTGELQFLLTAFPFRFSPLFWFAMAMSCLLALALNYAVFWNVSSNSPLTHEVTAQTKSFATLAFGFMFFKENTNFANLAGITLSLLGSSVYGYVKYLEVTSARPILKTVQ